MKVTFDGEMIIDKHENMKLEIGQKPLAERLLAKHNTSKRN